MNRNRKVIQEDDDIMRLAFSLNLLRAFLWIGIKVLGQFSQCPGKNRSPQSQHQWSLHKEQVTDEQLVIFVTIELQFRQILISFLLENFPSSSLIACKQVLSLCQ